MVSRNNGRKPGADGPKKGQSAKRFRRVPVAPRDIDAVLREGKATMRLVEYAAGWAVKRNMKVTSRPIGGIC
jgi:hypothetical protein